VGTHINQKNDKKEGYMYVWERCDIFFISRCENKLISIVREKIVTLFFYLHESEKLLQMWKVACNFLHNFNVLLHYFFGYTGEKTKKQIKIKTKF